MSTKESNWPPTVRPAANPNACGSAWLLALFPNPGAGTYDWP